MTKDLCTRWKNYDGQRYGNHIVIRRDHKDERGRWWFLCRCDCGKEYLSRAGHATEANGCGCKVGKSNIKHGKTHSRLYRVWGGMKTRCFNKNNREYKDYGGRGITMCEEWLNDFQAFSNWSYANGYDENTPYQKCTLDRIDVDGNYEPSNCRWADNVTQNNNKRCNRRLTYRDITHTIGEWSKITGISVPTICKRLNDGWSAEDALTTKVSLANRYKRLRGEEEHTSISDLLGGNDG